MGIEENSHGNEVKEPEDERPESSSPNVEKVQHKSLGDKLDRFKERARENLDKIKDHLKDNHSESNFENQSERNTDAKKEKSREETPGEKLYKANIIVSENKKESFFDKDEIKARIDGLSERDRQSLNVKLDKNKLDEICAWSYRKNGELVFIAREKTSDPKYISYHVVSPKERTERSDSQISATYNNGNKPWVTINNLETKENSQGDGSMLLTCLINEVKNNTDAEQITGELSSVDDDENGEHRKRQESFYSKFNFIYRVQTAKTINTLN